MPDDGANAAVRRLLALAEGGASDAQKGVAWTAESCTADATATLYGTLYDAVAAESLAPV